MEHKPPQNCHHQFAHNRMQHQQDRQFRRIPRGRISLEYRKDAPRIEQLQEERRGAGDDDAAVEARHVDWNACGGTQCGFDEDGGKDNDRDGYQNIYWEWRWMDWIL